MWSSAPRSTISRTNSSPQSGKTITNIEGCKAADSMTKLPADTKHDAYTAQ